MPRPVPCGEQRRVRESVELRERGERTAALLAGAVDGKDARPPLARPADLERDEVLREVAAAPVAAEPPDKGVGVRRRRLDVDVPLRVQPVLEPDQRDRVAVERRLLVGPPDEAAD